MTNAGTGTGGLSPVRPRGGPPVRGITLRGVAAQYISSRLDGRRLALVLIIIGVAVATAGAGTAVSRSNDQLIKQSAQPSAPNDPRAGNRLPVVDADTTVAKIPGAAPLPPPVAAADERAAAAVAIHIPRLKVNRSLVGLRVQSDRSLTVPDDFDDVGWWSGGPHPGGPGATLFAGHVNNRSGPAVFYNLRDMRVGDVITVDRSDQTSAVFKVVGRASFPRKSFPDEVVYRTTGKPSIHLVTCDGAFNTATNHYLDNLVVFADLVADGPTKKVKS